MAFDITSPNCTSVCNFLNYPHFQGCYLDTKGSSTILKSLGGNGDFKPPFTGKSSSIVMKNQCMFEFGNSIPTGGIAWSTITANGINPGQNYLLLGSADHLRETGSPTANSNTNAEITFYNGAGVFFPVSSQMLKDNSFYNIRVKAARAMISGIRNFLKIAAIPSNEISNPLTNTLIENESEILSNAVPFILGQSADPTLGLFEWHNINYEIVDEQAFGDYTLALLCRGNGSKSLGLTLLSNIEYDCDQENIKFKTKVAKCSPEEGTNCKIQYCGTLSTQCPNINFANFPYKVRIMTDNGTLVKEFTASGNNFNFDMDNLPSNTYFYELFYLNGKNIKININNAFNENGQPNAGGGIDPNHSFVHDASLLNTVIASGTIVEYAKPSYFPGDLIIEEGAYCKITNKAHFSPTSKVLVKKGGVLDVKGSGELTSCSGKWKGVILEGGGSQPSLTSTQNNSSQNGIIRVYEGGIISNAKIGVTTKSTTGTGGVIYTYDGHFFDNDIAIQIEDFENEQSLIKYSTFVGGETAIDIKNNNGLTIEESTFTGVTDKVIVAYNSGFNLYGSTIQGVGNNFAALYIYDDLPPTDSQTNIGKNGTANLISNCQNGIFTSGFNAAGNIEVQNTHFSSNDIGVFALGSNDINTSNCTFTSNDLAELYNGAGTNGNSSERNEYDGYEGIKTVENNRGYSFLTNCFDTYDYDVKARGMINENQGNEAIAASNCFTKNGIPDFDCQTDFNIKYFVPSGSNIPPCMDPSSAGNYSKPLSQSKDNEGCGAIGVQPYNQYTYIDRAPCFPIVGSPSIKTIDQIIFDLITKINLINNNPLFTQAEKDYKTAYYKRHLKYAYKRKLKCKIKGGNIIDAIAYAKSINDIDIKILAIGLHVSIKDYSGALAYINTLNAAYPGHSAFFNTLTLSTEIKQNSSKVVTQAERIALHQQALTNEPFAAYARSLYYKLTNTLVLPTNTGFPTKIRSKKDNNDLVENYIIGPNPISDYLNLTIENFNSEHDYSYEIFSIMGTSIKKGRLSHDNRIELSNITQGLNIIKLFKDNKVARVHKFISTKK